MGRSHTPNVSPRPGSTLPSAPLVTPMTLPWPNVSSACSSIIGLFKTEVINQIGPWKSTREVEWETRKWADWHNNRRLLGPIGYVPPAKAEEAFYANLNACDIVASSLNKPPFGKRGAGQVAGKARHHKGG